LVFLLLNAQTLPSCALPLLAKVVRALAFSHRLLLFPFKHAYHRPPPQMANRLRALGFGSDPRLIAVHVKGVDAGDSPISLLRLVLAREKVVG